MEETRLTEFVRRPGLGREGERIKVRTNCFEVKTLPEANIAHYDVTITPKVPIPLNRKVFRSFVQQNRQGPLGGVTPVYDGEANMYSYKPLPFGQAYTDDNVTLSDEEGAVARKRPPRVFVVRLRKTNQDINMYELQQFLDARSPLTKNCITAITALNVLVHYKPSITHETFRSSFYTPRGAAPLSGGLEIWQGYYQSVRPTRGKMMVNIDLSATAFYQAGPLVQTFTRILGRRSPDDLRRGIPDRERQKAERIIRGLRIVDNHMPHRKRRFKIERLTPTPASNTMFEREDGSTIDVASYFQEHHRRLNYPFLPCVVVRKKMFLPMEVCDVIEGQRYGRKLGDEHIRDMIKFTCQNPTQRSNKIRDGLQTLDYRNNEYLRQFGMSISPEMAVVSARVLPAPQIEYHPTSRDSKFKPQFGKWDLRDKKLATGAMLGSWSVLQFFTIRDNLSEPIIQGFVRTLVEVCQGTGMNIPNTRPPIINESHQGNIEEALKKAWLKAGNAAKAQPQLILCILPNKSEQLYAEIKRVSDTVIGVATQCVQGSHVRQHPPKKQYCANVCLKMNVKLGGMNSFLTPNEIPFITEKPTILFGADVTHPRPGENDRPSIAGLCASMDARASRYAASIRIQDGRTEIIADLANMVKELLKTFYQTCGRKPERIVFYRDGVSESQFSQVLQSEIRAVKAACQALDSNYKPTITFVVVQKKHHTRFFPMEGRYADRRSGNCLPGTVVESEITHPFEFDFYLQSHAGLIGTSRPAHYHVLYDENGFNSDTLQTLSYNLCYLYARCTSSVSMVTPVYYAHLVCVRAKYHSRRDWSDSESSEPGAASTYGTVKAELQRVMYFM